MDASHEEMEETSSPQDLHDTGVNEKGSRRIGPSLERN